MKYSEYQVWFHAFNNAISALARQESLSVYAMIQGAEQIAEVALKKFKGVEQPQTPDLSNLGDMKTIVDAVVKKAAQGIK